MRSSRELIPRNIPNRVSFTETFDSSEQDKQAKFTIDKSLIRGIRQNNSSLIVEQEAVETQDSPAGPDIAQETEKIALDFRSRYDRLKTQTNALNLKTQKMREELQTLRQQERVWAAKNNETKESYLLTESRAKNFDYEIEEATLKLDTKKNMQERLKRDIVFYKKNLFDRTIQHRKLTNDIRRLTTNSQREQRLSLRCKNLLQSVERTLEKNRYERNKGIELNDRAAARIREFTMKELERSRNIERSMEEALTMKLPEERDLIRVRLTNLFLKKLLHSKMNGLMAAYEEVNNAFTAIKQNTSVKTTEEFIHHYLYKDQIYGQLLESVAKAEEKIEALNDENKKLHQEGKRLQSIREGIAELLKQKEESAEGQGEINVEATEDKLKQVDSYRNSITLWALCLLSMVRKTSKSEIRSSYDYLGDLFGDSLRMLLKILEEEDKQASISEEALAKQLQTTQVSRGDLLLRNLRIKTTGAETGGRDEEPEYDMHSEREFLQAARKNVKKKHFLRARLVSK